MHCDSNVTRGRPQRSSVRPSFIRARSARRLAATRWHQADPHLFRIALGERIQRAVQRVITTRDSQCGVVHNDKTSPDRHQSLAQAVQSHPAASGPTVMYGLHKQAEYMNAPANEVHNQYTCAYRAAYTRSSRQSHSASDCPARCNTSRLCDAPTISESHSKSARFHCRRPPNNGIRTCRQYSPVHGQNDHLRARADHCSQAFAAEVVDYIQDAEPTATG